jgi:hypothetical protein
MTFGFTLPRGSSDTGSALLVAVLMSVLLCGLGLGLVLLASTETALAANYRTGSEVLYAADAAVEFAASEIRRVPSWTDVLTGVASSSLFGGTLTPVLPSGEPINLLAMTTEIQSASDGARGLGANNPQWRLYAHGLLSRLAPASFLAGSAYIAVWVADDPSEVDGDPIADRNGTILALARSMGSGGARRVVEATLFQTGSSSGSWSDVRIVSWREVR